MVQKEIKLYIGHLRKQDRTSKLMQILKDHLELLTGMERDPLEHPKDCNLNWIPPLWLVGLGKFLNSCKGNIVSYGEQVVNTQREGD